MDLPEEVGNGEVVEIMEDEEMGEDLLSRFNFRFYGSSTWSGCRNRHHVRTVQKDANNEGTIVMERGRCGEDSMMFYDLRWKRIIKGYLG